MNPYLSEDVMWERLKDIQREMENSRLYGAHGPSLLTVPSRLGARVWWLGRAPRRPPRRNGWVDGGVDSAASQVPAQGYVANRFGTRLCSASGPPPAAGPS